MGVSFGKTKFWAAPIRHVNFFTFHTKTFPCLCRVLENYDIYAGKKINQKVDIHRILLNFINRTVLFYPKRFNHWLCWNFGNSCKIQNLDPKNTPKKKQTMSHFGTHFFLFRKQKSERVLATHLYFSFYKSGTTFYFSYICTKSKRCRGIGTFQSTSV